jgi:glycerophosphoryl diester phosphodiesterase
MLVLAHRGNTDHSDDPENTLPAFTRAWQSGCRGIELDIHLTGDDNIVVIHDPRTGAVADIDRVVAESTLKDLQSIPIRGRGEKKTAATIPTLTDVFLSAPGNALFYIEIKCGACIIPLLQKTVARAGISLHSIVFIGFRNQPVAEIKRAFPDHQVLLLFGRNYCGGIPVAPEIIDLAKSWHADGVDIESCTQLTVDVVSQLKRHDLSVHTYLTGTYQNNVADLRSIIKTGIDSITTDRPGWVRENL